MFVPLSHSLCPGHCPCPDHNPKSSIEIRKLLRAYYDNKHDSQVALLGKYMFGHEKFGAYQAAIEFAAVAAAIIDKLPAGHGKLVDQFRRASIAVPLNIAEGSGKSTYSQKRYCYAIARGEAMECAAIVDVLTVLGMIDLGKAKDAKALLEKVAAILSAVCKKRNMVDE